MYKLKLDENGRLSHLFWMTAEQVCKIGISLVAPIPHQHVRLKETTNPVTPLSRNDGWRFLWTRPHAGSIKAERPPYSRDVHDASLRRCFAFHLRLVSGSIRGSRPPTACLFVYISPSPLRRCHFVVWHGPCLVALYTLTDHLPSSPMPRFCTVHVL